MKSTNLFTGGERDRPLNETVEFGKLAVDSTDDVEVICGAIRNLHSGVTIGGPITVRGKMANEHEELDDDTFGYSSSQDVDDDDVREKK